MKKETEFEAMQRKAGLPPVEKVVKKQQLDENIGGVVGIGAINSPFLEREKTEYENAFDHFLSEQFEGGDNSTLNYQFSEHDFDITQEPGYKEDVIKRIKADLPDVSDEDIEKTIKNIEDYHYSEARKENKRGRDYNSISSEDFSEEIIGNMKDLNETPTSNPKSEGDLNEVSGDDYDDPNSPLAQLNDGPDAKILIDLFSKYGKDVVQYWVTSGEFTDSEYR